MYECVARLHQELLDLESVLKPTNILLDRGGTGPPLGTSMADNGAVFSIASLMACHFALKGQQQVSGDTRVSGEQAGVYLTHFNAGILHKKTKFVLLLYCED